MCSSSYEPVEPTDLACSGDELLQDEFGAFADEPIQPIGALEECEQLCDALAHAHGHGKVNIAIEGRQLFVEMEVPGADIVGFEHQAKTNGEKTAVAAAKKAMRSASDILELPAAAGCKLAKARVELHSEDGHGDHREFHAAYTFECASMGKLGQIRFRYFTAFKGAQELDVAVISATGAKRFEATRQQPVVELGGL